MHKTLTHLISYGIVAFAIVSCTDFREEDAPVNFGVDTNQLDFAIAPSTRSVTVSSGTKWDVSSMPSWVSLGAISRSGRSSYEWIANFSAVENDEYNREGKIMIKAGSDAADLTVTQEGRKGKYLAVESVLLSLSELTLTEGENTSLSYTITPANASIKNVTWKSSATSVVTVSQDGRVEAIAPGTAHITVTTEDGNKTSSCVVTVKAKVIPVSGVSLDQTSLLMTEGDVRELIATVTPSNATNKSVTWTSSNTTVATVSNGTVRALSPGTTTITATTVDGGFSKICTVSVEKEKTKARTLSFAGDVLHLEGGDSYSLRVSVAPDDAICNLSWTSSNSAAVSVAGNGETATLTANYNSTGYTTVTVTDQRTGLSASIKTYSLIENFAWNESKDDTYSGYPLITIAPGGTHQLKYTSSVGSNVLNLFGKGNTNGSFVYYEPYVVDSPANITVSPEGFVTGVRNGITGIKPTGYIQGNRDYIYIRVASSINESEYNDSKDYANTVPYGMPMVFGLTNTSDVDWFKLLMDSGTSGYVSVTISVEYSGASTLGNEARLCKYSLYDSSMQQWGGGSFSFSNSSPTSSTTRSVPAGPLYLKVYFDTSYTSGLCPQYNMTLRMTVN